LSPSLPERLVGIGDTRLYVVEETDAYLDAVDAFPRSNP
jgi:hypothetical protein